MKEMAFMAATAILFVAVAAVALFVWHSWYLYCGAVLAGYVALMLLTVILKRRANIEFHYLEQFVRDKSEFYGIILDNFGFLCLCNLFIALFAPVSTNLCILLIFANVVIAVIMLIATDIWCERGDWSTWIIKSLFE